MAGGWPFLFVFYGISELPWSPEIEQGAIESCLLMSSTRKPLRLLPGLPPTIQQAHAIVNIGFSPSVCTPLLPWMTVCLPYIPIMALAQTNSRPRARIAPRLRVGCQSFTLPFSVNYGWDEDCNGSRLFTEADCPSSMIDVVRRLIP